MKVYKLIYACLLFLIFSNLEAQEFKNLPTTGATNDVEIQVGKTVAPNKTVARKLSIGNMKDSFWTPYPTVVSGLLDFNNAQAFWGKRVYETSGRVSYVDMAGRRITIDNNLTADDINTKIGNVVYNLSDDSEIATAKQDTSITYTSTTGAVAQLGASSTFSGWSSEVGSPSEFKMFRFTVNAFDNALLPTKIRVKLYAAGNVIYDDSMSVSLTLNVPKIITVSLQKAIKGNTSPLFIEVLSNGRMSVSGNGTPNFSATLVGKYSTNASITSPNYTNAAGGAGAFTIKVEFLKVIASAINFLPLSEQDMASKLGFQRRFSDSLKTGTAFSWQYQFSIFSGWGWSSRVVPAPFRAIELNVRGFDNANLPTQITVRIRKNVSGGTIVGAKTVAFLPSSEKLTVDFDTLISMTDTAWVEYVCNGKIGLYAETTTYGNGQSPLYTTSQVLTGSPTSPIVPAYPAYRGYCVFLGGQGWRLGDLSMLPVPTSDIVKLYLPQKIRATVGKTTQVFFRSIIGVVDINKYNIKVTGTVGGAQYPRYYEFTPSVAGSYSMTITLSDDFGHIVSTATTTIVVKAAIQNPASAKKILPVGDSLTDGGVWTGEAIRMVSGTGGTPVGKGYTNVQFIGTRGSGTNKYEGYGGKTWQWYSTATTLSDLDFAVTHNKTSADLTSVWVDGNSRQWRLEAIPTSSTLRFSRVSHSFNPPASGTLTYVSGGVNTSAITYSSIGSSGVVNPFWNSGTSQLDFANYVSTNSFGTIDAAVILLGWNQIADPTGTIVAAKVLLDKLHTQYPSAKVKIAGLQLPSLNGGLAANYGDSEFWSNPYQLSKNVWALNKAYEDLCLSSGYSTYCEYIDVASVFDSENNGLETTKAVNLRNAKTEYIGTNGVHPATGGYYQIADAVFNYLISEFCQ